jgi:multisubunit Na+/H+ antiporter MnhB subunit
VGRGFGVHQKSSLGIGLALPLCISIAAVYACFLTRSYYWDGVLFALQIEQVYRHELPTGALFHPNHLLYTPFGFITYAAAAVSGLHVWAIKLLQLWNAALGGLTGYVIYLFAKRETGSQGAACFCWILFAFGATWWKFSTDADAYIVSVLLLSLTVLLASGPEPRLKTAACCHIGAMLFHQLAVFGYVPVLIAIACRREKSVTRRAIMASAYVATSVLCVTAAYFAGYRASGSQQGLRGWITSYAADTTTTHSLSQALTTYPASYVKLFAGGKLSLIRDQFAAPMVLGFVVCAIALAYAVMCFRRPPEREQHRSSSPGARLILWSWVLPAAAFFAWFDPGSAFHKLFIWPPIVLLLGTQITAIQRRPRGAIALAAALAAWNFGAFIYPHARDNADPVLMLAKRIDAELPGTATVYYKAFSPDDWYLRYFAPGRKWKPLPVEGSGLACFETTALEDLEGKITTDPNRRWGLVNQQHNVRLECLEQTP